MFNHAKQKAVIKALKTFLFCLIRKLCLVADDCDFAEESTELNLHFSLDEIEHGLQTNDESSCTVVTKT